LITNVFKLNVYDIYFLQTEKERIDFAKNHSIYMN